MVQTRNQKRKREEKTTTVTKPSELPKRSKRASTTSKAEKPSTSNQIVVINRAPVLTLWCAVVSERQGFSTEEALTYGKWVSGILAQSKGRSLGIYEPKERTEQQKAARKQRDQRLGVHSIEAFGMKIPTIEVQGQRLAVSEGKPLDPNSAESYLQRAFGSQLADAKAAMNELATAIPSDAISHHAYHLYERFRPAWKGWGAKGELNLGAIRAMKDTWMEH